MQYDKNLMTEVLKDTVEFYSKDPLNLRCDLGGGQCSYMDKKHGVRCAIGRIMDDKDIAYLIRTRQLNNASISDIYQHLKSEKIKKLPLRFLEDLQDLHDSEINWDFNCKTISKRGKIEVDKMQYKIDNNHVDYFE